MAGAAAIRLRLEQVPEGQARGFAPPGQRQHNVFVVRHRGRLHAWRDACPHVDGARMAWREHAYLNADGSRIVCSAHGAQFDIASGVCTLGPCIGAALTAVPLVDAGGGEWLLLGNSFETEPGR